jgi:hypothetical protein
VQHAYELDQREPDKRGRVVAFDALEKAIPSDSERTLPAQS